MTIAISNLATTAITIGLLVLCLGLVVIAGALDELIRRRIAADKKKAARIR